ncbi:hypothetical protein DY000_02044108 [Brassica cretica]|uniref:Uncharacterized protein n=1 Tax=Brassica cretica TaxID=69181 RepID=A0ABQ7BC18_BRACR|nr:hypothetical protein DY000_02044108 [Brassica cretica]
MPGVQDQQNGSLTVYLQCIATVRVVPWRGIRLPRTLAAAVAVEARRPTGLRIYAFHFNQAGQERLSCRRLQIPANRHQRRKREGGAKEKGGWETTGDGGEKLWLNSQSRRSGGGGDGGGGYGGGMVAKNKAVVATNKAQPRRSDGGGDRGRGVGGYRSLRRW